jgi:hypothetical protein
VTVLIIVLVFKVFAGFFRILLTLFFVLLLLRVLSPLLGI